MAGLYGVFQLTDIANSGNNVPQTVMTIWPPDANTRARITEYAISFDGTNSANTPAKVEIGRVTGGTYSSSTNAPTKINDPTGSLETLRFNMKKTVTVEPTYADILRSFRLPVFGGTIVIPQAPGQEDVIPGSATVGLGIRVTANAAVNVSVAVRYEE